MQGDIGKTPRGLVIPSMGPLPCPARPQKSGFFCKTGFAVRFMGQQMRYDESINQGGALMNLFPLMLIYILLCTLPNR